MTKAFLLLCAAVFLCGRFGPAVAADYPLTVTDLAGRQVTIPGEPERIGLQDGRDILMIALLDRADPFKRLVVWNNIQSREDPRSWRILSTKWPEAAKAVDMGFGDDGQVNVEEMLLQRPQLVIAELRAKGSFEAAGVDKQLAALNIPIVYVDLFDDPVANTPRSIALLGAIFNRRAEAGEFTSFYSDHLTRLQKAIATVPGSQRPRVFVEPLAGRQGPEQCCLTHGDVGWGLLVQAIGAKNIGSELLAKRTGDITLETVLAQQPDMYLMTGRITDKSGSAMPPFGYGAQRADIDAALQTLEKRPGFDASTAARNGRVFGLWHLFYSHPFNIVALEWLAKFAYPNLFSDVDPDRTYRTIIERFTQIPDEPFIFAAPAPEIAP